MKRDLQDRYIFLAASYPKWKYRDLADSQEIAAAVKALLAAVFHSNGKILFGAHPSISPLVLMMARECGVRKRICIYQSEVFKDSLSEATLRLRDDGFGEIVSTEVDWNERPVPPNPSPRDFPKSLTIMREQMLSSHTNPAAAVFIGGDTGLFQERTLFSVNIKEAPVYAVGAPGGAAREIAQSMFADGPSELRRKLVESRNYLSLMQDVVTDIEDHLRAHAFVAV